MSNDPCCTFCWLVEEMEQLLGATRSSGNYVGVFTEKTYATTKVPHEAHQFDSEDDAKKAIERLQARPGFQWCAMEHGFCNT